MASKTPFRVLTSSPRSTGNTVFLATFVVYFLTAARRPQFGDGLELMAAAAVDGIAHPTGYPTLTMFLSLFAQGDAAYFSASLGMGILASAAAALIARMTWELAEPESAAENLQPILRALPVCMGLLVGFSAALWPMATHVEVYALNAFFLAALLLMLAPKPARPCDLRQIGFAGILMGLALTNHVTSACMAPLLLWRVVQAGQLRIKSADSLDLEVTAGNQRTRRTLQALGIVAITGAIGLLPYLWLPIQASNDPAINWGDPDDLRGFVWVVSGGDYADTQFLQAAPGRPFTLSTYVPFAANRSLQVFAGLGLQLFGGMGERGLLRLAFASVMGAGFVMLAVVGGLWYWRQSKLTAIALAVAPVAQLLFILLYNIPDIGDYFLGLFLTLTPFLVAGTLQILPRVIRAMGYDESPERARRLNFFFAALVVVALLSNWGLASRRGVDFYDRWIDRTLEALPENALLLTHADYDTYALWYAQHVEGRRTDVLVASANFLRNSWYETMVPQRRQDPHGRVVGVEPADVLGERLTVGDHVKMLSRNVIYPNLDGVPVYTTSIPWMPPRPNLRDTLTQFFELEPRAVLLTDEELIALMELHPGVAPPLLEEIVAPATPSPGAPAP